MQRLFHLILSLLIVFPSIITAQIMIDGRKALYDSRENVMLATVPQSVFNTSHRARIELEDGWSNLKINGTKVTDYYTFSQIKAGKTYAVTIQNPDQYVITSDITFTFLPLVHLTGTFGYDYQDGMVSVISPDDDTHLDMGGKVKWRGGSTNTENKHKRNYKLKLNDDVQLFGLRNDNKWILDAGQADLFRVRNRIATELWNDMCRKPYYADKEPDALSGVRGRMVEVFLNKEYRGIYCLTECMDRKELKLKKFDQKTGEIRGGLWKSKSYGISVMWNYPPPYDNKSETWDAFEVKYPELDDLPETDYSTLYNAIYFVRASSDEEFRQHVAEYFDMPVLIDYYIFLHAINAYDNRGKNMYWAVYDKTKEKKITPAVWDLDGSVGQRWIDKNLGTTGAYTPDIVMDIGMYNYVRLENLNPDHFNEAVASRYNELRKTVLSTDRLTARYMAYYDAMALSGAAQREENLWSGDTDIDEEELNLESEIYYITYWLTRHLQYLDEHKFKPSETPTDITVPMVSAGQESPVFFNLKGQRMERPLERGIYIRNGRKYVVR